jgi:hypothetical protein
VTAHLLRRLLGGLLVLLSFAPLYTLLDADDDALRQTLLEVAGTTLDLLWTGTVIALLLGVLLAFLLPRRTVLPHLAPLSRRLASVSPRRWALGTGALAFSVAAAANFLLFRGFFTNIDEISSFIHARYLAAGHLAGSLPVGAEGWLIPNMLTVDAGWVSQFPPSHLLALAGGHVTGLTVVVGPVFFAAMTVAASLSFTRLLPDHPGTARVGGLLVVLSPFLILVGAGGWSHATAGAFLWMALYAALRARDGHAGWAVAAGAAIGLAVCSRPWISILLGTVGTLGVWLPGRPSVAWLARRAAGTVLGGVPFALALGWYNRALFGGPTTLGYVAAFGERHGLGFHLAPWGNPHTPLDALSLTSVDVVVFGSQLLETPVPVGAAIGLWLLLARRLPRGAGVLAAWALVPLAGNALYWFHSVRMLYEASPAWLVLGALALAPIFTEEEDDDDGGAGAAGLSRRRRIEPASIVMWAALASGAMAIALGAPQRLSSFTWDDDTLARLSVPEPADGQPALVFVHSSWNERLSARLQAAGGMRQDSVISLLRRNTNCRLDEFARARAARSRGVDVPLPDVDLRQLPGTPAEIVRPPVADGTTLRTVDGERFPPSCQRELAADRFGAVALAPLLWQGDLPGIERGAPLFVRDLGPEWNRALLEHYDARTPWVFVPKTPGAPPELVPYDEAMQVLWGATATPPPGSEPDAPPGG